MVFFATPVMRVVARIAMRPRRPPPGPGREGLNSGGSYWQFSIGGYALLIVNGSKRKPIAVRPIAFNRGLLLLLKVIDRPLDHLFRALRGGLGSHCLRGG